MYAWGDNQRNDLALDSDRSFVPRPEPNLSLCPQKVSRIELKGAEKDTMVAYIDNSPGGTAQEFSKQSSLLCLGMAMTLTSHLSKSTRRADRADG